MSSAPPPPPPRPAARSLQVSDHTLLVCDGTLLYVFTRRQSASVLPVSGLTGVQWMRRSMAIRNRFATDVMVDVDKEQLDDARAFGDWLLSLAPADVG